MNIEKGYYYVSTGAKTKMYTLRHYFQEMRCSHIENGVPQDVYWVERDWHVTNLSTDLDKAMEKAKARAKRAGTPLAKNDNPESLEAIRRRNAEEMLAYRLEQIELQKKLDAKRQKEDDERWATSSQDMFTKIRLGKVPYGIWKNKYFDEVPQGYLLNQLRKKSDDLRWANINDAFADKIREKYPLMESALDLEPNGKYFGTPKKRTTFTATLINEFEFESYYGWMYVQKFITDTGECVVYKGSNPQNVLIGETVEMTATPKEHTEYKGEKQTPILRIKITEDEKEVA